MKFLTKYFLFFLACLGICTAYLLITMPEITDYYVGADEGVYYRQTKVISQKGFTGFREIADNYIQNENEHVFPHPLRAGHLILATIFVTINDSITSLSILSIVAFLTLCIVSFFFIKKHWDEEIAFFAATFISFSPLAMAMARRALMDSEVYLFFSLPLFAFINYITAPSRVKFALFLLLLSFSILVKETALFLLPFYTGALLVLNYKNKRLETIKQLVLIVCVPLVTVGLVYLLLLGGVSRLTAVIKIVLDTSVFISKPFDYVTNYMSGPWYQYFIDYFILSPVISILFFLSIGYFVAMEKKNIVVSVLLTFMIWLIFCLGFLSKDIRYAINLDLVYRIFAALIFVFFIRKISTEETRRIVIAASLLLFIFLEITKFNKLFVTGKIYDPVAYNLLVTEKFIPGRAPQQAQSDISFPDKPEKILEQVIKNPTAEAFLELSVAYYRAGDYDQCIIAANKALELKPDFADAYNNLCSAYTMLKEYDKGIEACEKALKIQPDFQLAKNNLKWATDEKNALNK